ncbi:MAG: class I SAM-dependent methyltransferase [Promethearchaeota archaeon]
MDENEYKELYRNTFNTVASGYDNSPLRFFSESAKKVPRLLKLKGNESVLDVATGTGHMALAFAKNLPNGQVTGIDFSEGMLNQAMRKKDELGLKNITFMEMDMQDLDFPDSSFDIATCAFSIFFVEDIKKQMVDIVRKVNDEGKILITTFFEDAFSPLVDLFFRRLENYDIEPPSLAWKRVSTRQQCLTLFNEVGLHDIKCACMECGYYLNKASDWWYIIWNAGFRGLVSQLSPSNFEIFKEEHFEEVQELATDKGIWLEMNILHTIGTKKFI